MTFEEWWGGDRDRTLAYDLMKVLTEAARQAWDAGHATSIEEMLEKWNRTGVDIDAALHGRVNEKSPIANRLRMIAAAQPRWQPIGTCQNDGRPVLVSAPGEEVCAAQWTKDGSESGWYPCGTILNYRGWIQFQPTHWMPLPEPPND